jgi:hypothetical protein
VLAASVFLFLGARVGDGGAAQARGVYVSFFGDEGDERCAAPTEAYGSHTYDQLRCVKPRFDPTNMFRCNQNVTPAKRRRDT